MPCLRTSPERRSTSKAPKRILPVREVVSMAAFELAGLYHQCMGPKEYVPGACVWPTTPLNSKSCMIRIKTCIDQISIIGPRATSCQCRRSKPHAKRKCLSPSAYFSAVAPYRMRRRHEAVMLGYDLCTFPNIARLHQAMAHGHGRSPKTGCFRDHCK
jgi:hypothetical protein